MRRSVGSWQGFMSRFLSLPITPKQKNAIVFKLFCSRILTSVLCSDLLGVLGFKTATKNPTRCHTSHVPPCCPWSCWEPTPPACAFGASPEASAWRPKMGRPHQLDGSFHGKSYHKMDFLKLLPSGKLTVCYWKWPFIVDVPSKKWWCSIVMLVYQMVYRFRGS